MKSSGRAKATRKAKNLPATTLSAKESAGVKGGMRKAGGDPGSAGKEFLQYKFGSVFTTKSSTTGIFPRPSRRSHHQKRLYQI